MTASPPGSPPYRGGDSGGDRRSVARTSVDLPVRVIDRDSRVCGEIRFDDLSIKGAFLRSNVLFEEGEELTLSFHLPPNHEVYAAGQVVRIVRGANAHDTSGMGIVFTRLSERERELVRSFLLSANGE